VSNSNSAEDKPSKQSQIIDLLNMPDNVIFSPDALRQITEVDVPLYLPNGAIGGKARVLEGDDEDAILIEVESSNPMVAELFKARIIGISLVRSDTVPPSQFIELDLMGQWDMFDAFMERNKKKEDNVEHNGVDGRTDIVEPDGSLRKSN
jgi:hypothetical protein